MRPSRAQPRSDRASPGTWRHAAMWLALAIVPSLALAQSAGGSYRIRKQVIAAGVETTGGTYRLVGTVGQAFASAQVGGTYRVNGGFHFAPGAGGDPDLFYCDGFEDGGCP